MSDLVEIRLHGRLGEMFGDTHRLAIGTPMEAIKALDALYPGFRREFILAECYYVRADGDWRDGDAGAFFPVSREVDIVPVVEGRAFLGAALIGALIPSLAGTMTATFLGGLLVAGLLLGITMFLSPKPKTDTKEQKEQNSYIFSGPVNVIGQGTPIPLVYGRCWVGSVVISAGLETGEEHIG